MLSYIRAEGSGTLPDLSKMRPFSSIVIIENSVSPERQTEISKWLVRSGCKFMMAWGHNCSSWDDSVDLANLEDHGFGDIPIGESVITTWHENTSLEELMSFAKSFVSHPDVTINNVVILHLGLADKSEQFESMYRGAEMKNFW